MIVKLLRKYAQGLSQFRWVCAGQTSSIDTSPNPRKLKLIALAVSSVHCFAAQVRGILQAMQLAAVLGDFGTTDLALSNLAFDTNCPNKV